MSQILSLHGQGLKLNTKQDIQPHLDAVDPANLAEIHLGGNTLGVEAAEALGEFLAKATSLKVADFADIFTGRLITEIPLALTSIFNALLSHPNPLLHTLNLSDNAFGGRSVDPFIPFLSTTTSLTTLRLNNNGLGPEGGRAIAEAIKANATHRKNTPNSADLQTVICGRNRLEDGSAGAWAEAFRAHGGLVEVRMPQNGMRPDGIVALAEGLKECKNLRTLDLQDNTFCAKGEKAWADALASLPDLQEINLSDCVLREEDDEDAVPQVLKKLAGGSNPKLAILKIQNNNLEAEAIQALADGISKVPSLKRLEILANDFDPEENEEVVNTLREALSEREGVLIATDEDEEEDEARQAEAAEAAKTRAEEPAAPAQPPSEPTPVPVQPVVAVPEPEPMQVEEPVPPKVEEPKAVEESKPADVKPEEPKPAAEIKPEEPKPAAEVKPEEPKPAAEAKPEEPKPAAEAKPEGPAAEIKPEEPITQAKPEEPKVLETKPEEPTPVETKAAEPAPEPTPTETKPEEPQSTEPKTEEPKPAEAKPETPKPEQPKVNTSLLTPPEPQTAETSPTTPVTPGGTKKEKKEKKPNVFNKAADALADMMHKVKIGKKE